MKKLSFILLGIMIGVAITVLFIKNLILPRYIVVAEDTGAFPSITFVRGLQITQFEDDIYTITTLTNPTVRVMINHSPDQNMVSEIQIMDDSMNSLSCSDTDSNGIWDSWVFSTEDDIYTYGRMSGYPDTVLVGDNEPLVRVDGVYYPCQIIDDKKFIKKDGELVEVEFMPTRYFKIK